MSSKNSLIKKAVSTIMVGMAFLFFSCQTSQISVRSPLDEISDAGYPTAIADYEAGLFEKALNSFNRILKEDPNHPEVLMIKYYQAFCHYHTKAYERSINLATDWLKKYPEDPERYKIQQLAGDASMALGQMYDASFWMFVSLKTAKDIGISDDFQDKLSDSISDIISQSSEDDLEKIKEIDGINYFSSYLYFRNAEIALEKNRYYEAKRFATLSVQSAKEEGQQQLVVKGKDLVSDIVKKIGEVSDVNARAIGCLLPLKGPFRLYGDELLNGIQLGMDIFNTTNAGAPLELIIKNTNGSSEETLSAIDDLITKEKVIAIIGPLSGTSSVAAVKRAQAYGIPIITFAQKQNITEEGDMVFRNYLTPSKEVDALINKAVNDMGMSRFGIFYPDTNYGNYFMNLFWDKVEEMGGEITAVESYKSGNTDFADGIEKMVGLYYPRPDSVIEMLKIVKQIESIDPYDFEDPQHRIMDLFGKLIPEDIAVDTEPVDGVILEATEEEIIGDAEPFFTQTDKSPWLEMLEKEMETELLEKLKAEPIADFDAVFIPDNSQNMALIAPQFPFYNFSNVPFLGTSLWMSDELISATSDYIQGAVFPVGFYLNDDSENIREFVRLYRETFEKDPGILAATGFDTIKMIKELLGANEIWTRSDFQKALVDHDMYEGVTGNISFDEHGEVEKLPALLTVHGRRLHLLP